MQNQKAVPQEVIDGITQKFKDEPAIAVAILSRLQYSPLMGCWGFMHAGIYHGVEPDGFIHT